MNEFKVEGKAGMFEPCRKTIKRGTGSVLQAVLFLLLIFPVLGRGEVVRKSNLVRNGSFNERGAMPQKNVDELRKDGWKCPDAAEWPKWWGVCGKAGTVEFPRTNGVTDGYARGGEGISFTGYHGLPLEDCNYVYTIWARGKGKLRFHVKSYGKDEEGKPRILGGEGGEAPAGMSVPVDSKEWVRYRHLLVKTPALWCVHPWPAVEEGALDIDEVDIAPSTPALDLIVAAEEALYGSGALIEDMDVVKVDAAFAEKLKLYNEAVAVFSQAKNRPDKDLAASLEEEMNSLAPYVLTKNLSAVRTPYYNEMIALTQVLNVLAGKASGSLAVKVKTALIVMNHKPGGRKLKKDTLMVTGIEPNKILYEEGEDAIAKVTLKNTTSTEQKVTLTALQYTDLDSSREVAQESMSIPAAGEKTWTIRYNVGPETYGRALEVRVMDSSGKELDRWQEYYQAAKEWLRVQMPTDAGRYNNMSHYFSSEPTDWGVQPTDAETWVSVQVGFPVNPLARLNQTKSAQSKGKKFTFYQNFAFGGIMGYEEMRKHPEYVLYDPNGQFAVDPVYGGCPNPMELASPIEIGPKRAPKKPYLDRKYTPWQHAGSNFAMEETVEYGAKCIREYAKRHGFDGVFMDGQINVTKGFGYDGKINIPESKKEVARLNARIQNLYCRILKAENPYFGTWYNYCFYYPEYNRCHGDGYANLGAGISDDVSDEWVRAMNNWKNVSCLMEWQHTFKPETDVSQGQCPPKDVLNQFIQNRDYQVQKYGGDVSVGYIHIPILDKPGLSKWGWPTINYFMAQIIASQHRIRSESMPSFEPSFQFQTRYSRFLWAPDIKVVPEAEKTVTVKTPEELWWQDVVYRRDTKDGYDLIIHLVRIPPTERWDINWIDEPLPLEGVKVTADIGSGNVDNVFACRPYHFEEEQQVVQQALKAEVSGDKATVEIPPFRYYTMVVIRIKK